MLRAGRIELTPTEHDAVDKLVAENPGVPVSFTRRDVDNTGPLLVHVGDRTHTISVDKEKT